MHASELDGELRQTQVTEGKKSTALPDHSINTFSAPTSPTMSSASEIRTSDHVKSDEAVCQRQGRLTSFASIPSPNFAKSTRSCSKERGKWSGPQATSDPKAQVASASSRTSPKRIPVSHNIKKFSSMMFWVFF